MSYYYYYYYYSYYYYYIADGDPTGGVKWHIHNGDVVLVHGSLFTRDVTIAFPCDKVFVYAYVSSVSLSLIKLN